MFHYNLIRGIRDGVNLVFAMTIVVSQKREQDLLMVPSIYVGVLFEGRDTVIKLQLDIVVWMRR